LNLTLLSSLNLSPNLGMKSGLCGQGPISDREAGSLLIEEIVMMAAIPTTLAAKATTWDPRTSVRLVP
jgi:hypothetical protein